MTQYVINIGAIPNDGTGDPLRTAFNEVNLNFNQVWATGLVGSNITIANNTILTSNTNGNLVLAPNGVGKVIVNTDIIPDINRVRSLGSSSSYWDSGYIYYGQFVNANIGNAQIGNSSTITIDIGNLHISGGDNGYVLQTDGTGNLTWTAQTGGSGNGTPGGSNTQVQFNDAGTFGGHPGFNFNKASDLLSLPGNVSAVGNVLTSGYVSAVGNVRGANFNTVGVVSATGNITGNYFIGNGSQLTGISVTSNKIFNGNSYANIATASGNLVINANANTWSFNTNGTTQFPGNVIQAPEGHPITLRTTSGNAYSEIYSDATVQAQISITDQLTGANPAWAVIEADMANVNTPTAVVILKPGDTGTEVRWTYYKDGSLTPPTQASNDRTGSGLVLKIGNEDAQAIITGPAPVANTFNNAPRLVVAGQDGVLDGEGGDIYLWAGRSGPDGGSGGDIKVDAGNSFAGSEGGTIKIRGGRSLDTDLNGTGGFVEIDGGRGDFGGPVTITGGLGNSQANSANVVIATEYGGTWTFDNYGNLTLPNGALLKDTSGDSVAFGQGAGANNQSQHAVAIGLNAGQTNQGEDSVAIGWNAGANSQSRGIAIGWGAGYDNQGQYAQAYGKDAGSYYQQSSAIAMGESAGRYLQKQEAIAIGYSSGFGGYYGATVASMQATNVVRIYGSTSGLYNGMTAVGGSIGPYSGIVIAGLSGEDVTLSSDPPEPLVNGDSLNFYPAQSPGAVAIGSQSAQTLQGQNAVAVGYQAGRDRQGRAAVSIGEDSGGNLQGINAIAIGREAGLDAQGNSAIAMGWRAGQSSQGQQAIAIGEEAGYTGQGEYSVVIGFQAGYSGQGNNSIVLNATGTTVGTANANTFTVAPVRSSTLNDYSLDTGNVLYYNTATNEITTAPANNITGDPFAAYISNSTSNVTVWTASSDQVVGAKLTVRVVYASSGWQNTEMLDITAAKTYPDGTPVFTVSNRVKTNPAYSNTPIDVTLTGGNVMQVISSAPDGVGNNVYWTCSATSFNQTFD